MQTVLYVQADWALYVVDAGQSLHFEIVYGAARAAGIYDPATHRVEVCAATLATERRVADEPRRSISGSGWCSGKIARSSRRAVARRSG